MRFIGHSNVHLDVRFVSSSCHLLLERNVVLHNYNQII